MNHRPASVALLFTLAVSQVSAAELTRVEPFEQAADAPVRVTQQGESLQVRWTAGDGAEAAFDFNLRTDQPLIRSASVSRDQAMPLTVLKDADPGVVVTVGTRDMRQGWIVFFDKVHTRPYESFRMNLSRESVRVSTEQGRTTITFTGASAGPFAGDFRFTFYPGANIVNAEAVMATDRPATAFLFDSGLIASGETVPFKRVIYQNEDRHAVEVTPDGLKRDAIRVPVRHRTIGVEGENGGYAFILPRPHQYFYPLDFCDNFSTAWVGTNYRNHLGGTGFGVCQTLEGDRRFVPWVNAPQGTKQEMGVFYLLSADDRAQAEKEVLAYTRNDQFKPLDGYKTFTSHYHVEMTIERLRDIERSKKQGEADRHARPEFVDVFREMGIEIAHLAEFHLPENDLKIAPRIDSLKLMHEDCARWSDETLLILPGEEPNVHLGGHWISFFPKPVYWTLDRKPDQPFIEEHSELGKIYHVGNAEDVLKLMEAENGLMWAAHPRIKSSTGFPDAYRTSPYFQSPHYLGGAWKAMPADYSLPRLGTRVLELLDDMSNWGNRKHIVGEVDVFAIDRHSELYAHMNVNYLKLDALPSFEAGWASVLDALRGGQYFTTTGEVLITRFTVDGKQSGDTLAAPTDSSTVQVTVEGTFPLDYAEIVSGDGKTVSRQVVSLADTNTFSQREFELNMDLRGKTWVRVEVWDVARNGAFTQPVWVEGPTQ